MADQPRFCGQIGDGGGGARADAQAHRRRGRLGPRALAQEEERHPGFAGPQMQPPGALEGEPRGIAAHLQDRQPDRGTGRRLLPRPGGVGEAAGAHQDQRRRIEAEAGKARPIGQAGLGEGSPVGDPQERAERAGAEPDGERQREPGERAAVTGLVEMDLGQTRGHQPAAEGGIDLGRAERKTGGGRAPQMRHRSVLDDPGRRRRTAVGIRPPSPARIDPLRPRTGACRHLPVARQIQTAGRIALDRGDPRPQVGKVPIPNDSARRPVRRAPVRRPCRCLQLWRRGP